MEGTNDGCQMLLGLYFFIVIALPLALGSYTLYRRLPRTRRCPSCAGRTLRLRSRRHDWASRLAPRHELQVRWCMSCGWQGTVRLEEATIAMLRGTGTDAATPRPDRVDLRTLSVDGDTWRVMVEALARQYLLARQLGDPHILSDAEMAEVLEKFKTYGRQPTRERHLPEATEIRHREFDTAVAEHTPILSETELPIPGREHVRVYRGVFPFLSHDGALQRIMVVLAPVDVRAA